MGGGVMGGGVMGGGCNGRGCNGRGRYENKPSMCMNSASGCYFYP